MSIKFPTLTPAQTVAVSLIGKDVVGCIMYTSTARANKDYSPEKRSDVASYDLANGIVNVGLQLMAVKPIEKLMDKFADTKLMKIFFNDLDEKFKNKDSKVLKKFLKYKQGLAKGAVALLSVIICQYTIKRFISPYLSVPLAAKFQQRNLIKPKLYEGETFTPRSKEDESDMYKTSNLIKSYLKR